MEFSYLTKILCGQWMEQEIKLEWPHPLTKDNGLVECISHIGSKFNYTAYITMCYIRLPCNLIKGIALLRQFLLTHSCIDWLARISMLELIRDLQGVGHACVHTNQSNISNMNDCVWSLSIAVTLRGSLWLLSIVISVSLIFP